MGWVPHHCLRVGQVVTPHLSPGPRRRGGGRTHHLRARGVVTEAAPARGQVTSLVMMTLVREREPVIGNIGDPDPAIGAPGRQLVGVRVIRV